MSLTRDAVAEVDFAAEFGGPRVPSSALGKPVPGPLRTGPPRRLGARGPTRLRKGDAKEAEPCLPLSVVGGRRGACPRAPKSAASLASDKSCWVTHSQLSSTSRRHPRSERRAAASSGQRKPLLAVWRLLEMRHGDVVEIIVVCQPPPPLDRLGQSRRGGVLPVACRHISPLTPPSWTRAASRNAGAASGDPVVVHTPPALHALGRLWRLCWGTCIPCIQCALNCTMRANSPASFRSPRHRCPSPRAAPPYRPC